MAFFTLDYICPPWLEDEALLIEQAGEMPEVALAESLHLLGEIPEQELACLRAACARGYLRCIQRDQDPANIGSAAFRGLERALANLGRLQRFLSGFGADLPKSAQQNLAHDLAAYLSAEQTALVQGRTYATASRQQITALAKNLALHLAPWRELLDRVARLPALDFIALRALKRLACASPAFKSRKLRGDYLRLELRGAGGNMLAAAALPWRSDVQAVADENRDRAEIVWRLLEAREETS
jgi:hypothetical protein